MTGEATGDHGEGNADPTVRQARLDDREAVVAFTQDTWSDREASDYIPDVFEEWVETDGDDQHTLVAEVDGEPVGIGQVVLLGDAQGWGQGLRVAPEYRGQGVSEAVTYGLFDWASDQGATVVRNMVFSWNDAGLGQSRATGYDPVTEFRWATPDPDPEGLTARPGVADRSISVTEDPAVAWRFWADSAARDHLRGLSLTPKESWALTELTSEDLARAADETRVFAAESPAGARGCAYRTRTYEREGDHGPITRAEYGLGAWSDLAAARALLSAIARDAADQGADRTRVLIPETPWAVTDAAYLKAGISDDPDFVLAADLTGDYRG